MTKTVILSKILNRYESQDGQNFTKVYNYANVLHCNGIMKETCLAVILTVRSLKTSLKDWSIVTLFSLSLKRSK